MGRLGYSTITLTDLTEAIPVTLVLETNQPKNIQTKAGSLYNPDFTQVGGELIITPTLFLGQEDLHIENQKDKFVDPHGRENGFIYYQVEVFDENSGLEKNYYYGSSDKESGIWVDEQGCLHYQKNLTENLTIEAYIDKFQNEEHSYVIDVVQSINPIQFLFLEEGSNNYTLIINSTGSNNRKHFEDINDSPIELEAILYQGINIVDTSDLERYSFKWTRLTDQKDFTSTITPNKIIVTRDDVYSEEKFVCTITDETTDLSYSGSTDIWDLKEDYDCVISSDTPFVTETTKSLKVSVTVFDSQSRVISISPEPEIPIIPGPDTGDEGVMPISEDFNPYLYQLKYVWGYYYEELDSDSQKITQVRKEFEPTEYPEFIISFNEEDFSILKNKSFTVFCNVYNETENSNRRLASEIHFFQFVTEHHINISPQVIFLPTREDGTSGLEDNAEYKFSFRIEDKNGNALPYNDGDSLTETEELQFFSIANEDGKNYWNFEGKLNLNQISSSFWKNSDSSKYCEFPFVYCGYTYSAGVTLVKNIEGKSSYSIVIDSSSGHSLTSSDTSTILTAKVYSKAQEINADQFYYKWLPEDKYKEIEGHPEQIKVTASNFVEKAVYQCNVYVDKEETKIIGTAQITLTDLTDSLPVYLMLKAENLPQNIQTKEGHLYTPDFSVKEIIVKPSLYIGQAVQPIPVQTSVSGSAISYQVGDSDENGEITYQYGSSLERDLVWVDNQGWLHYKKNLTKSITIEAFINNYKIPNKTTTVDVFANNPINIAFVESGGNEYTALIKTTNNRDYFDESNQGALTLEAELWKGTKLLSGNEVTYEWDIVTDTDSTNNNSDDTSSLDQITSKPDFKSTSKSITVNRKNIFGSEIFICTMRPQDNSNSEYTATKVIRDFADTFTSQIIADSSLVLTPNHMTVELTHQIWNLQNIINDDNSSHSCRYEWYLLKEDGTDIPLNQNKKTITITAGMNNIPLSEVFTILGKATVDGKTTTVGYVDIRYQPIEYTVEVSPKTFFIPVTKDGLFKGKTFVQNFTFRLLDNEKNPLLYSESKDGFTTNGSVIVNTQNKNNQNQPIWSFDCSLKLSYDNEDLKAPWEGTSDSKIFDFNYKYLGQNFEEEILVVKNYAGENGIDGQPGSSGYTIDLSNEFHSFAGGEMRADPNQETSTTISAFLANQPKKIDKIWIGTQQIYSGSNISSYKQITGKAMYYKVTNVAIENESNVVNVKLDFRTPTADESSSGIGFLTETRPLVIYIQLEGLSYKIMKTFNYTINYNSKSYYLSLEPSAIKQTMNGFEPTSVQVSALYRDIDGAAKAYSNGRIVYRTTIGTTDGAWKELIGPTKMISNFTSSLTKIKVRLYSAQATGAPLTDSSNDQYILDEETIPVLKSMDGYELGGENLIRWSKTLSSEANKWDENSENISITSNEDFSEAVFNGTSTEEYSILRSPKILISEELRGKTLCLSFDFYCANYNNLDSTNYAIFIAAAAENSTSAKTRWGTIGSIKNTEINSTFIFNETPQNGKWIRVYKTFKLDSSSLNNSASTSAIENCKYFWVEFVAMYNSDFKIKKPKLELGNIPSSWSSSPYDIDYSDIVGANLVTPTKYIWEVNGPTPGKEIIVDNLKPDTYYTISFKNSNFSGLSGKFNICVLKESTSEIVNTLTFQGNSSSKQQQTFKTPQARENYQLYFYAGLSSEISDVRRTLKVVELKVEEGVTATDFFLTEDYLNSIITNVQTNQEGLQDQVTILTSDGAVIQADIDNLQDQLANLSNTYVTINSLQGEIEAANEKLYPVPGQGEQGFGAYIAQLRGSIKISAKDATNPYLQIKVASQGTSNSTKLTHDRLSFMNNDEEVAYISNQELCIKNAKFLNSFIIGNSKSGELTVSVTETGIGFSW